MSRVTTSSVADTDCQRSEAIRVRLEYEGEGLEPYLPLEGAMSGHVSEPGDGSTWAVVQLDKPLEYQYQIGQPYQFRLVRAATLFIRARHVGYEAGRSMEASVHVLIPLQDNALSSGQLDLKAVHHAAWAMCKRI